jgi:hypothetical protein
MGRNGQNVPVHPVHKMLKLVLLGRQGGNQRISCIHAYFRLCSLRIRDLHKIRVGRIPPLRQHSFIRKGFNRVSSFRLMHPRNPQNSFALHCSLPGQAFSTY